MTIAHQSKSPFFVKFLVHELGEICHHISSARVLPPANSGGGAFVEIDDGDFLVYWPQSLVEKLSDNASVAAKSAGIWMPYRMREKLQIV
ncbi:hypothetical protein [Pectobacterium carotovorum]|uniref:hypothetical protein n=1 Tax=Pectobacterium carotovorum TaxID=554 RepID=UPI00027E0B57|nr:hypothetical protein [Pectobacterium carotovorum]AFR03270.1 hypothetical protein PCC21_018670 [Pectobacterium carotovorum subsp. carotovorum PCC21]